MRMQPRRARNQHPKNDADEVTGTRGRPFWRSAQRLTDRRDIDR